MSDREVETINVAEEKPDRKKRVYCVFCYKKNTKNNIRRHCDEKHKTESAGAYFTFQSFSHGSSYLINYLNL